MADMKQVGVSGVDGIIGFVPAGVIFDVDDTLLDNYSTTLGLGLHEQARLLAVREVGLKHDISALATVTVDINKTIIQRAREHTVVGSIWQLFYELGLVDNDEINYDDPLLLEIAARKHELYPAIMAEYGAPLPNAVEFVKAMYVLTNGRIAIASGAQFRDINTFLITTGLDAYFLRERIISGNDVDPTRAKPHSEPFDMAFASLGLPESTRAWVVAFEDDPKGIESAKAAGLYAAAITSRFPKEVLLGVVPAPDIIAEHYVEFAERFGVML